MAENVRHQEYKLYGNLKFYFVLHVGNCYIKRRGKWKMRNGRIATAATRVSIVPGVSLLFSTDSVRHQQAVILALSSVIARTNQNTYAAHLTK